MAGVIIVSFANHDLPLDGSSSNSCNDTKDNVPATRNLQTNQIKPGFSMTTKRRIHQYLYKNK